VVLGHVSDKEGEKESKSKGNYTPPEIILDEVKMDFAVVDAARYGVEVPDGQTAVICNEDLEGMDLAAGATVEIRSFAGADRFVLNAAKKLPRRVILLREEAMRKLAVVPTSTKDIKPVEVPWLDREQRVTVKDVSTTAPGADAFRWFFYAASPPWSATRHSLSNVRALQKEFAVKLRNVYSFFTIYGSIDGFDPSAPPGAISPTVDDRWIAGELAMTVRDVTASMDAYDVFGATQHLVGFVDALSNWWVRRSRARFWRSGWDADKASAYATLYRALVTLARLTAPFTPYGAEAMYQNLVVRARAPGARESVHLEDWPDAEVAAIDEALSRKIRVVRELVSIGLRARTDAKIKVRQPLRTATILLNDERDADLVSSAVEAMREELNVLEVRLGTDDERSAFGKTSYKPNFRTLGQRGLGKLAQELKKAWASAAPSEVAVIQSALRHGKAMRGDVEILRDDIELSFEPAPGVAAAADRVGSVFLDTKLDDELRDLGFVRELQNRIQTIRKELGLEYTDRIRVHVGAGERVGRILQVHRDALAAEVLAVEVSFGSSEAAAAPGSDRRELDIEGETVALEIARVPG
jgi:isoleucyl-tRNA synthetase